MCGHPETISRSMNPLLRSNPDLLTNLPHHNPDNPLGDRYKQVVRCLIEKSRLWIEFRMPPLQFL